MGMFLGCQSLEQSESIFTSIGVDPHALINTKEMQRAINSHGVKTSLTYRIHDSEIPALLYLKLSDAVWHWIYYDGENCFDPLGGCYGLDKLPGLLTRVIS
ncbi:hypothetical protein [Vibrio vulnificus]|uniref:hypothetical protein n=1 Tax=Vibrio vulnificus TaxID=672 RepID=UPI00102C9C65|nr:hypothetical protein [Vibrio vulnificus]